MRADRLSSFMNELLSFAFLFSLLSVFAKYQNDINLKHDRRLDELERDTAVDRHRLLERFETFEEKLNAAKVDRAIMIEGYEARFQSIEMIMQQTLSSIKELSDLIRESK